MKKLFTVIFSLLTINCFAQNAKIDSLQNALENYDAQKLELRRNLLPDESDSTKVNILIKLSWEFKNVSNYTAANKYAAEALVVAEKIGYKRGIARAYNNIGAIHGEQDNYAEALKYHFASLKIRQEVGDRKGVSASLLNIGLIYWSLGKYPEALKNFFNSLKIAEEMSDKRTIADNYSNIGLIHYEQGNFPGALKAFNSSLKIRQEIDDERGLASSYSNIGTVMWKMGNNNEALKNFLTSLKINQELGYSANAAICYNNIALIFDAQKNYPEALKNYFTSLKISEEIGDKDAISLAYQNIGTIKLQTNNIAEAKEWFTNGLQLAKEIGAVVLIRDAYENIAVTDSALGNFKGAYENHKLFVIYRDSLVNEENTRKITQMQMQYDFDKKELHTRAISEAELNKQKLLRNGFVGGFAVVLLFAGVFFRQRNKTMREKLRSEEEKKRSEDLLLNILPGEVADEIKNSGTAKAKAFTMVTVMFTDFKDFTNVSEKISAELLVDEIHTCFSAFDNILSKYKIEKIKTIGDAYLCASGLPVSTHTHAMDMLNAAFEIRSYMLQRKKEKEAKGEIPFELRIGIHTGPVVAGVVGVRKYAYDIWGDTVNIAARMEQNSEAGKINISGSTYELVKDKFKCEHRGKISAKNKGEIDMYFVETVS